MNDKKGISPLIATVLIVGFTIVLAVLVITWISGTVNDTTSTADCNADASNICLSSVGNVDAVFSGDNVLVTNEGSVPLGARVLFINPAGDTIQIDPIATVNPASIPVFDDVQFNSTNVLATNSKAKVILSATSTKGDGCTVECGSPIEITYTV